MEAGSHHGQQATGQAQMKRDEVMDKAREGKGQAAGFIQQTGEQIKSAAQGAVETVKNAVGMGDNNSSSTTTTHSTTANTRL